MVSMADVPCLSLPQTTAGEPTESDQALLNSLQEFGFVRIRDHGLENAVMDEAFALTRSLFELAEADKEQYTQGRGGERGYIAFGRETAVGESTPDLKEYWHVGHLETPLKRVSGDIRRAGFGIVKNYRVFEFYHRIFLLTVEP